MTQVMQPNQKDDTEVEPESQLLNNVTRFPSGSHVWRQQGFYLVCMNCPLHHAIWIGSDKVMVGEDKDGKPILRDRASI